MAARLVLTGLVVAMVTGGIVASISQGRQGEIQDDLASAQAQIEDLEDELEDAEEEADRSKQTIRRLRSELGALASENAEYTSDDYGVPGIVLDTGNRFICEQWPRCWDIEAKMTISNNTDEGSGIECLVVLNYEDGSTTFEPLWSDYVPAGSSETLTFVHYQDNSGPDIDHIDTEGCKRYNGPDGGGDI